MSDSAATTTPAAPPSNDAQPPVIGARAWWGKLRWLWLGLGCLFAVVIASLFFFNPAEHSFYPFCFFHRMTGWQCPGCGGLRAMHQLLHGHFLTAFQFNPLVVGAAPLVLALLVRRWLRGPGEPVPPRVVAFRTWLVFVVLVVFWIVRNLPLEFFRVPGE